MLSFMLSNFLVGIREGLEAALIVGILIAYIVKVGNRKQLAALWIGVAAALTISFGTGGLLTFTSTELSERGEQVFAGATSLLAVGLVTWMVFWMKSTARGLRDELQGKVAAALTTGPIALALVAFFAVVREGLETAVFAYANFQTATSNSAPALGLTAGIAAAVLLGWLIYRRAIAINLSTFFTITGVALIVIAAGVLAYGVHEFQELGWFPGDGNYTWNITAWMAKDSIAATFLQGTIGFRTSFTWVELLAWGAFLAVILPMYLRTSPAKPHASLAKQVTLK
jgi:high-affinity iron transporter